MDPRLLKKEYRLRTLYSIRDKEQRRVRFVPNKAQAHFNANKHSRNIILKSRQLGFCLDPKTRVLTTDLLWIPIEELIPGQEIIAVEEFSENGRGKGRKMKPAIIEAVGRVKRKAYKITFDDGRFVICTGQHPWLSSKVATAPKWRAIDFTDKTKGKLQVGTKIRWITKPWEEANFEDGWFGGILDGEGSIAKSNVSAGINASQRSGDVWDRMVSYCESRGYHYRIESDTRKGGTSKLGNLDVHKICIGRMDEMFRLIGQTRPSRFLNKKFWENRELPGKKSGIGWAKIVKIEELGERIMIDLQTSAKTYIAEGFVSHNTSFESIDSLDDALFTKNFSGMIISHEQKISVDIFKNKIYFAWDNFPDFLKNLYKVDTERANQLIFDFGDKTSSTISVGASGRSGTFNRIHVTELGKMARKYPDKARELLEGTIPSVPMSGRVDIESTAEGNYGLFYDMFWEAWNRNTPPHPTEYKAHFYNWTWDEAEISQVKTIIPIQEMDQWKVFKELQEQYKLTDQQITYYYLKWLGLKKNWNALKQEYPTTPEEAFVGSGHRLFNSDKIAEMKSHAVNGIVDGNWIFYEPYIEKYCYAMGVDIAEGVGQDSSTIVILCFNGTKAKVVAEYCSNKIPPDQLAYEIRRGGLKYGECIAAVERNNHGHATLAVLKGIYFNIYTEIRDENIADKITEKLGWLTTGASKPRMMYDLSQGINDGLIDIPSKYILEELNTYDKEDVSITRFNPDQSKHWDRVMALGIAWQMKALAYEAGIEVQTHPKETF